MSNTYDLIFSTTLTSSVSSYTINSIPGTYRDLVLSIDKFGDWRTSLRFNGDSGTNYIGVSMQGLGTTRITYRNEDTYVWTPLFNSGGNAKNLTTFYLNDYAQTNKRKNILARSNIKSGNLFSMDAWIWRNTSAITSIYIEPQLNAGDAINLYGIVG
jgi:hypothetical protein